MLVSSKAGTSSRPTAQAVEVLHLVEVVTVTPVATIHQPGSICRASAGLCCGGRVLDWDNRMDKGFACPQSILSRWGVRTNHVQIVAKTKKFRHLSLFRWIFPRTSVPVLVSGSCNLEVSQRGKSSRTPTAYRRPGNGSHWPLNHGCTRSHHGSTQGRSKVNIEYCGCDPVAP